ncbi:MAG: branched-chain amino acid ABC transporter permease, partial [Clostridiales bacterium]|nr:branched-chain amino acid ABC transporter permease [Clostridiales bacterium]
MWWLIGQGLISGILSGGVYALIAVGLSVVFGVMKIVNFAMGEFLTTGMYVAFVGYMLTGYSAYALIPFVIIVMVAVGSVSFTLAIKPLIKRKDPSSFIMVTVGLSFFLINLVQIVFGADYMSIPSAIKSASIAIGDFTVGVPRLIALCVSIVLVVLLT